MRPYIILALSFLNWQLLGRFLFWIFLFALQIGFLSSVLESFWQRLGISPGRSLPLKLSFVCTKSLWALLSACSLADKIFGHCGITGRRIGQCRVCSYAYCSAVLSAGRQTELYIALLHLCLPQFLGRIQEGAVPALLSASATVSSSTSLPAACLSLPWIYWSYHYHCRGGGLEAVYPVWTGYSRDGISSRNQCSVHCQHHTPTCTVKKCTVANLKIAGDTLPRFVLAHFADRLTFNESYILTPNI